MSSELIDTVCRTCWGKMVTSKGDLCPRCKGSGEEPAIEIPWWAVVAVLVILLAGLYFVWGTELQ